MEVVEGKRKMLGLVVGEERKLRSVRAGKIKPMVHSLSIHVL